MQYFLLNLPENIFGGEFMKKCIVDVLSVSLMVMGVIYICENKTKLMNMLKKPMEQMVNGN